MFKRTNQLYDDFERRTRFKHTHVVQCEEPEDYIPPIDDPALSVPPPSSPHLEPRNNGTTKGTQNMKYLSQFHTQLPTLAELFFAGECEPRIGEPCRCGTGALRNMMCFDCRQFAPLCPSCFLKKHHGHELHYARVWGEGGYFAKKCLQFLDPTWVMYLGHDGDACPALDSGTKPFAVEIVHINGKHSVRVQLCHCPKSGDRVQQFMHSRMYPSTKELPRLFFTWDVLQHFHILNLEGKLSSYDFVNSLRRITDNAFPTDLADMQEQFVRVMREYRTLQLMMKSGVFHKLNEKCFPHRPPESLVVRCLACPEEGFNTIPGWEMTPPAFRHLTQLNLMMDGNHQLNKTTKNTDPYNISLMDGNAYHPQESWLLQIVGQYKKKGDELAVVNKATEKTPCEYLKAVGTQDRLKFRGVDVTGVVSCQCAHIMIRSLVDLQLGERFCNGDLALYQAFSQINHSYLNDPSLQAPPHRLPLALSYDIACAYSIHALERWKKDFPRLLDLIEEPMWLIPLLHVTGHKDACTYLFSSTYQKHAARHYGEGVEHPWAEAKVMAPSLRQMNNGMRQDTMNDAFGDWNFKKVLMMGNTIIKDLATSICQFKTARERLLALCSLFGQEQTEQWEKDRPVTRVDGKNIYSAYCFNPDVTLPNLDNLYKAIISSIRKRSSGSLFSVDGSAHKETIAQWLRRGVELLGEQAALDSMSKEHMYCPCHEHEDTPCNEQSSLETRHTTFLEDCSEFLTEQGHIMPTLCAHISVAELEEKSLVLPSTMLQLTGDYDDSLLEMVSYEAKMHYGALFSLLMTIRTEAKMLSAIEARQGKASSGVNIATRHLSTRRDAEKGLKAMLASYHQHRSILQTLGQEYQEFPNITLDNLRGTSLELIPQVSGLKKSHGRAWMATGIGRSIPQQAENHSADDGVTTQMSQPRSAPRRKTHAQVGKTATTDISNVFMTASDEHRFLPGKDAPTLTVPLPQLDFNSDQIRKWLTEGDRVEYFRTQAQMERWQEEWELKQAEAIRVQLALAANAHAWGICSDTVNLGQKTFAMRQRAIYTKMNNDFRTRLELARYQYLLLDSEGKAPALVDILQNYRQNPQQAIQDHVPL